MSRVFTNNSYRGMDMLEEIIVLIHDKGQYLPFISRTDEQVGRLLVMLIGLSTKSLRTTICCNGQLRPKWSILKAPF